MANTKKEWRNMSAGEKFGQIAVNVIVIAIAVIATLFLYAFPQDCTGLDKQYLYCYTHPGTIADAIGMVLFWFGCFWLSGIWGYFVQDDGEPWGTITKIAWGCAVAGPALILLF